ncbi:MAG: phosphoribosylglycinamide formyltransferase [Candidatus Thorarchaeota archaeon]
MSRVGVLISGRGTNLQALIDAQEQGMLGGQIVVVISNKSKAQGLERARKAGIKTVTVTRKEYPQREDFDRQLLSILRQNNVDLVVLAGFMRILTNIFISEFANRIINVHPSLLPSFRGVEAQWQAVDFGVRVSGCTTHFVSLEMDAGPIILQRAVPVHPNDDGESLSMRILKEEHEILVESVRLFCDGKLKIEGQRVIIVE